MSLRRQFDRVAKKKQEEKKPDTKRNPSLEWTTTLEKDKPCFTK
jgi:hypothetical protein